MAVSACSKDRQGPFFMLLYKITNILSSTFSHQSITASRHRTGVWRSQSQFSHQSITASRHSTGAVIHNSHTSPQLLLDTVLAQSFTIPFHNVSTQHVTLISSNNLPKMTIQCSDDLQYCTQHNVIAWDSSKTIRIILHDITTKHSTVNKNWLWPLEQTAKQFCIKI